jgi:hypothetical protein
VTRVCDVCDQERPCVTGPSMVCGIETFSCHECRGEIACHECTDAYLQDLNDRDYDAQGNPRP